MRIFIAVIALLLITATTSCAKTPDDIRSSATGEVITDIPATPARGGGPFDGTIDQKSDFADLVETAWGDGRLGLHRGHAPIERVLEAFLGITHDEMHIYMEQSGLNLAGVCDILGFEPKNLIDSLTASFIPFIEEGVKKGIITSNEATIWKQRIRDAFTKRIYWEG